MHSHGNAGPAPLMPPDVSAPEQWFHHYSNAYPRMEAEQYGEIEQDLFHTKQIEQLITTDAHVPGVVNKEGA